jgi:L-cystine uptake protein TcyP (sodium:dicarboxylate symporter family)
MIFKIIGGGLIAFGIIDFVSSWVWRDITGVWWSAIAAVLIGSVVMGMDKKEEEQEQKQEQQE